MNAEFRSYPVTDNERETRNGNDLYVLANWSYGKHLYRVNNLLLRNLPQASKRFLLVIIYAYLPANTLHGL